MADLEKDPAYWSTFEASRNEINKEAVTFEEAYFELESTSPTVQFLTESTMNPLLDEHLREMAEKSLVNVKESMRAIRSDAPLLDVMQKLRPLECADPSQFKVLIGRHCTVGESLPRLLCYCTRTELFIKKALRGNEKPVEKEEIVNLAMDHAKEIQLALRVDYGNEYLESLRSFTEEYLDFSFSQPWLKE